MRSNKVIEILQTDYLSPCIANGWHLVFRFSFAAVWLVNGLYCKLLGQVPRHRMIVAEILGVNHSLLFTRIIGIAEVGMALWILSNIRFRLNAITQIAVISIMNLLEFILVPELLLWGKWNALFAFLFVLLIGLNAFILKPKITC